MTAANFTQTFEVLNSWYDSNEDDHIIADYLRKKILKESNSLLMFYFFLLVTCLMVLLYTSMIMENLVASIIAFVFCVCASTFIYITLQYISKKRLQINNRDFKTCLIDAYEISDSYDNKYCLIMDKEKHSLTNPFSYHSYFSYKETDGILVVLPSIEKNKPDFTMVLPRSFITCEKEDRIHKKSMLS